MEEYKAIPASVHRSRGRCCKSACIHCPYGFTMKNNGLQFLDFTPDEALTVKEITIDLSTYVLSDYKKVLLKETVCAYIRVDKLFVRELYLFEDFSDQGISKEVIESYYFY